MQKTMTNLQNLAFISNREDLEEESSLLPGTTGSRGSNSSRSCCSSIASISSSPKPIFSFSPTTEGKVGTVLEGGAESEGGEPETEQAAVSVEVGAEDEEEGGATRGGDARVPPAAPPLEGEILLASTGR